MNDKDLRERVGAWASYIVRDTHLCDAEMTSAALGIGYDELLDIAQDIISDGSKAERTCTVDRTYTTGQSRYDCEIGAFSYLEIELSCGHEFTWDGVGIPSYCPYCGSKVITDGD